jgi:alpha-glucosidase
MGLGGGSFSNAHTGSWSLSSPDGQCVISVSLGDAGDLSYQVSRGGKNVIQKSPLGLRREDQDFERALVFDRAGEVETRREKYELFTGPQSQVDHILNHRSLTFRNAAQIPLEVDLAASDQGVAFRYRFTGPDEEVRVIQSESTGFALPAEARGWLQPYHAAGIYTPAYEDFYFPVSPGDPPPQSRGKTVGWAFPALFKVPQAATWVLVTESGTDEAYCACHLRPDSSGGIYHIAFPSADEATKGHPGKVGPEPRHTVPWTMPWRVMVMGKSAGDIATSTLVTDLAAPSLVDDTSWITPGRAAWAWWSYPDGPATAGRFNEFTDFAAKMSWEYTMFDAGWWEPGLGTLARHAREKQVMPLAWVPASESYDVKRSTRKLDELAAAGVRGVKVDFWCSDRQETIAAQLRLMKEAAARKLVVNLHGCTLPRGWQRTWPNYLTCEAVLGTESYFYESHYTEKAAELNTVLPFTRNAVGPMDVTPVACSPKKYARRTTAAHELATTIVATSGIIHYADGPDFFESLPPEVLQILRHAPARWEETRCLLGEPGHAAIFARRSGKSWFIAGLNGTGQSLPVTLDLSAFKEFPRRLLVSEGADAHMQAAVSPVTDAAEWKHEIPPRGGFILRLDQ